MTDFLRERREQELGSFTEMVAFKLSLEAWR